MNKIDEAYTRWDKNRTQENKDAWYRAVKKFTNETGIEIIDLHEIDKFNDFGLRVNTKAGCCSIRTAVLRNLDSSLQHKGYYKRVNNQ